MKLDERQRLEVPSIISPFASDKGGVRTISQDNDSIFLAVVENKIAFLSVLHACYHVTYIIFVSRKSWNLFSAFSVHRLTNIPQIAVIQVLYHLMSYKDLSDKESKAFR